MKLMKKKLSRVFAALLSLVLVFGFAACGDAKTDEVLPEVKNVSVAAVQGAIYGKVGEQHVLSYETPSGSNVSVSVLKDAVSATSDDYTYTVSSKTIVFHSEGHYTVTVYAAKDGLLGNGKAEIDITKIAAPTVNFWAPNAVNEEEGVVVVRSVDYAAGDRAAEECVTSVEYKANKAAEYTDAAPHLYSLENDLFIPHDIGYFRLQFKARGVRGGASTAQAEIEVLAAELSINAAAANRIPVGTMHDVNLSVQGPIDKFNVSVSSNSSLVTAQQSDSASAVAVKMDSCDYGSVTVTYTHKKDSGRVYSVDINVQAVEDIENAPLFTGDPFMGIPDHVLTSMGYLLYPDNVKPADGEGEFSAKDIQYEIIKNDISYVGDPKHKGVDVLYAAEDRNYPYLIVTNYDDNSATGTFTLKMTATDPATGKKASATKTYTVVPTKNDNATAQGIIYDHVKEYSDIFDMGAMNLKQLSYNARHNVALTRTGLIFQRSNPSWPLKNDDETNDTADFAIMNLATPAYECTLNFKMTILGTNGGKLECGIGVRTGDVNGWVGFIDIKNEDDYVIAVPGFASEYAKPVAGADLIPAEAGTVMYFSLQRRLSGNNVVYTLLVKQHEEDDYLSMCSFTVEKSTTYKAPGALLAAYQFSHRNGGGCFMIEDVTLN